MNKLEKILADIKRAGMTGEVKEAPKGANSFDKMIVVWLPRAKPFLYQVHLWNSKEEKVTQTFN
jgi:hypothetical protein